MSSASPSSGADAPTEQTRCQSCEKVLEPVFSDATTYQFSNALWIGFFGGYGMFVDEIDRGDDRLPGSPYVAAALCHECSHALCDEQPWIAALLKPQTSHAHSFDKDWGSHTGWDLPHREGDVTAG